MLYERIYGAVDVSVWIESVQAVLYAGFAGEAMNEARAGILSGKACLSGRLSETFSMCVEDTAKLRSQDNGKKKEFWRKGIRYSLETANTI